MEKGIIISQETHNIFQTMQVRRGKERYDLFSFNIFLTVCLFRNLVVFNVLALPRSTFELVLRVNHGSTCPATEAHLFVVYFYHLHFSIVLSASKPILKSSSECWTPRHARSLFGEIYSKFCCEEWLLT
uniref:Uncharacterized protein n=1 Tax=Mus musculus TaxID=10090 RepID=Q8C5U6_MOUSE|nr:unnamed protein product [Mus musculus]